ncbi:MAG: MBOAT family protein [Lachnospiraceae bacterium]|nr:MBOAT family protein [Lachnospiraceae bacterium]MDD7176862.1 MBOAT family protein [bacterium]MDY5517582.1 MBOAT family protein [Lachnospiraceae bacterium]
MVFSSMIFLCVFLPVVLIVYFGLPKQLRNLWLLLASLFFYAWGEPRYILIMLFSTAFDYLNGRMIEYATQKGWHDTMGRGVLVLSVVGNLGILCFFKYTDFALETVNRLAGTQLGLLQLALPIGISFYTFQTMSYTIDVYRGETVAQHNIISFGMYVCLFPQLIAGPIVRYKDVQKEVDVRQTTIAGAVHGLQRFLLGLAKKVLLANQIGVLWDYIKGLGGADMSTALAWLGAIAFTFQIYFDFSGYSDMAIGLGELFGFHFPENFDHPYESKSITEFWRRWHMTLGTWFREYLYIPLGGNRKGLARQILNLFIVWFLTGLWHGAGWNFILWGLYYFALLVLEKFVLRRVLVRLPDALQHVYTLFFVIVGWVIFACEDLGLLGTYLKAMFGIGVPAGNALALYEWDVHAPFLIILLIAATTIPARIAKQLTREDQRSPLLMVYTLALLGLSMAFLVSGSYNPFLYFRF